MTALGPFRVVDLTRPLDDTTVLWPGTGPITAETLESIEKDGSYARRVTLDEHSGTHFDAPSHFASGAGHVADVPADQLVRPLRIIDFTEQTRLDPDAELSADEVEDHEAVHGSIAGGSVVFLRTDLQFEPGNDVLRFPGFGVAAARKLVEERGVLGLGTDTLGIDPGRARDFPVHRDVTLPQGVWHVENLTNLAEVPSIGALAVVGVPRIVEASGFPARVFALVPQN